MQIANLNAGALRKLIKVVERRDSLLSEIQSLDSEITQLLGSGEVSGKVVKARKPGRPRGSKVAAPRLPKAPKAGKVGRRGALKDRILKALEQAGSEGIVVRDLAKQLKVNPQNIHVWFSSTGKNVPGIQKIGEGRYSLSLSRTVQSP